MKETCLKLSGTVDAVEEAQWVPELIHGVTETCFPEP